MKKIFTLFLVGGALLIANAQCTPNFANTVEGISPTPDSIPCVNRSVAYNQTIQIFVPATIAGLNVEYVQIDSITNAPCGMRYAFNKPKGKYNAGEKGCMQISGTTTDAVGQYRLGIYVEVKIVGVPTPLKGEVSALPGAPSSFKVFLRVKESASTCPAVDTSSSATNRTSTCKAVNYTSISKIESEFTSLTISPNPVNQVANISFVAEKAGNVQVTVTNLSGVVVASDNFEVSSGSNNLEYNASGLAEGVYFYTIRSGNDAVTKRFVVTH